jgi:hypothetical protein
VQHGLLILLEYWVPLLSISFHLYAALSLLTVC